MATKGSAPKEEPDPIAPEPTTEPAPPLEPLSEEVVEDDDPNTYPQPNDRIGGGPLR